jgi:ethanolamine utilization protein EutN
MIICEVVGHVWATKKDLKLEGLKLMIVQEISICDEPKNEKALPFVAADIVGSGIGEKVLVVGGSTARKAFGGDDIPIDNAIVGIIDSVEAGNAHVKG